jgi:CheY-like chemotaxis protein
MRVRGEISFGEYQIKGKSYMEDAHAESSSRQEESPIKTVLIVEDDADIGEILVQTLKDGTSYQVILASDGFVALKIVRTVQPDLFVLDYQLPGMDGLELIDHLRATKGCEQTPIMFMSANPPWAEIAQRQLLFLEKPFELDAFLRRIQEMLI